MERTSRRAAALAMLLSTTVSTMLIVRIFGASEAFSSPHATALAAIALLLSLPLVDSSVAGSSVHPAVAGAAVGAPLGFFVRQASVSEALAGGASRVLAVAAVLSLGLLAWRLFRRRGVTGRMKDR